MHFAVRLIDGSPDALLEIVEIFEGLAIVGHHIATNKVNLLIIQSSFSLTTFHTELSRKHTHLDVRPIESGIRILGSNETETLR